MAWRGQPFSFDDLNAASEGATREDKLLVLDLWSAVERVLMEAGHESVGFKKDEAWVTPHLYRLVADAKLRGVVKED